MEILDGHILRLYHRVFLSVKGRGPLSSVHVVFLTTELSCPYRKGECG